ncbi:hypothetical protein ACHAC9_08865 [Massilia sp. CMS3.1]|uniref:hypothetical protein n=1 Tax=Massilia sp. CMS3.1 TaxID=3373083 RepID=UPI003EE67C5C
MRNLDAINPALLKPSKFASLNAGTLLALVIISAPLAWGAAPEIPLRKNPIVLFIGLILAISLVLALISAIFRWGWKAKYYGISLLGVAGISFLAVVPFAAAVIYGKAPYWVRVAIFLIYGLTHFFWCRKFMVLYKNVFSDEVLRAVIYEEESDAVYYMRRGDDYILSKYYKFSQTPRDRYFVLFIFIALLMIPIMSQVCKFIGIPFVHIFLMVAMLPVSWLSIGLAVRAYLIFYLYPGRIKRTTGKEVYVDLVSKHRPLGRRSNKVAA